MEWQLYQDRYEPGNAVIDNHQVSIYNKRKRREKRFTLTMERNDKSYLPRIKKVISLAKGLKAKRLLDIGCGDGGNTVVLKEACGADEVHGIDISPEVMEVAKEKGIDAVCLDINKDDFPFENDYFDVVYCGEIIEHLLDPDHLLDEVYRILKPQGSCLITTPNLGSWHCRLHLLMGYQPYFVLVSDRYSNVGHFMRPVRVAGYVQQNYINPSAEGGLGHVRFFTLRALRELLKLHSFQIKETKGYPIPMSFPIRFPLSWLVGGG